MKIKFLILTAGIFLFAGCGNNPEPKSSQIASKDDKAVQKDQNGTQTDRKKHQKPCESNSSIRKISGLAPLKIKFNSNIIDSKFHNIDYKKIEWSFGDNTISSEKDPLKIYEKTGIYPVSCTVEDKNGNRATERLLINVSNNENNESYLFIRVGENALIQDKRNRKDDNVFLKLNKERKRVIKKIKIATGVHVYTLRGRFIDKEGVIRIDENIKKKILAEIAKTKYCQINTYSDKEMRATKLTKRQISRLLQD